MIRATAILGTAVFLLAAMIGMAVESQTRDTDFPVLKGPYLGQTPPGSRAEVFAPGIISTGNIDKCAVFTPRGDEFYFSVLGDSTCFIAVSRLTNGIWSRPSIPQFSRKYMNLHCCVSPDGSRLYFSSEDRPRKGGRIQTDKGDIWVVKRTTGEWSEPEDVGPAVNSDSSEFYPSVSANGDLYFYRRGHGGKDDWDIFVSRRDRGDLLTAERMPDGINTPSNEFDPFIAPDQSYLIFASVGREDSLGGSDLYISYRCKDGSWGPARNLGLQINSDRWEFCPGVTPDGKYLFFASNRRFLPFSPAEASTFDQKMDLLNLELTSPGNGHSDFYWINADILREPQPSQTPKSPLVFASYMVIEDQVHQAMMLCESIRTFAGSIGSAPIRLYYLKQLAPAIETCRDEFERLSVELITFQMPAAARRFPFGWKPFVAARAETDALGLAEILVYLDANIILIDEPKDFLIPAAKAFAYRPVMHRNIGSLYSDKPDPFWARIYQLLEESIWRSIDLYSPNAPTMENAEEAEKEAAAEQGGK